MEGHKNTFFESLGVTEEGEERVCRDNQPLRFRFKEGSCSHIAEAVGTHGEAAGSAAKERMSHGRPGACGDSGWS